MKCYLFTIILGLVGSGAVAASELSGRVVDFQNRPLTEATVLVNTAAPRQGVAVFCPSCYVDCGKRTTTDDDGRFTFSDLDPSLVFDLVATAEGHRRACRSGLIRRLTRRNCARGAADRLAAGTRRAWPSDR